MALPERDVASCSKSGVLFRTRPERYRRDHAKGALEGQEGLGAVAYTSVDKSTVVKDSQAIRPQWTNSSPQLDAHTHNDGLVRPTAAS